MVACLSALGCCTVLFLCRYEGVAIIKEFVNSGGTYLGFCAGAYFAAYSVQFELNTAMGNLYYSNT